MFSSTSDKVLDIILQNQDLSAQELIGVIKSRLGLSQMELYSALAELSQQDLITTMYADDELYALHPQPYALSRLMTKREMKIFSLKWDIVKILLGFVLGFVSAWLLK